jgi:uncharacterized protein YndB with AHSA1/START domain
MRRFAFAIAVAVAALLALGAAVLLIVPNSGTHVASTVRIHRDIADVFAFFTTPKNWPRWHPASISVAGATDHSLAAGEEVTEEFRMGSGKGRVVWRVAESNPPPLWRIEGAPESGDARVTITYSLRKDGQDTVFERNMDYQFNRLWLRVLDLLFIRRHMERESQQALANAKQILEH